MVDLKKKERYKLAKMVKRSVRSGQKSRTGVTPREHDREGVTGPRPHIIGVARLQDPWTYIGEYFWLMGLQKLWLSECGVTLNNLTLMSSSRISSRS